MSLVKGQPLRPQLSLTSRFVVGFFFSATVTFAVVRALGDALPSSLSATDRTDLAAFLFLASVAFDFADVVRRRTYSLLSWPRQTPRRIATNFGIGRAALAWGLDAGLGFSTYRVTSVYWLVIGFALLGLAPWWIGAVYALAFLTPLIVGWCAALAMSGSSATVRISEIASTHRRSARLLALSVLCAIIVGYVALLPDA